MKKGVFMPLFFDLKPHFGPSIRYKLLEMMVSGIQVVMQMVHFPERG